MKISGQYGNPNSSPNLFGQLTPYCKVNFIVQLVGMWSPKFGPGNCHSYGNIPSHCNKTVGCATQGNRASLFPCSITTTPTVRVPSNLANFHMQSSSGDRKLSHWHLCCERRVVYHWIPVYQFEWLQYTVGWNSTNNGRLWQQILSGRSQYGFSALYGFQ